MDGAGDLIGNPYGRVLVLKVLLFAAMLGIAAANRFRHTPALQRAPGGAGTAHAVAVLRTSIALETALAVGVLGLVSWLGTLAPLTDG